MKRKVKVEYRHARYDPCGKWSVYIDKMRITSFEEEWEAKQWVEQMSTYPDATLIEIKQKAREAFARYKAKHGVK